MYCTKCGKKIDDDSRFCDGCGNPVAETVNESDDTSGAATTVQTELSAGEAGRNNASQSVSPVREAAAPDAQAPFSENTADATGVLQINIAGLKRVIHNYTHFKTLSKGKKITYLIPVILAAVVLLVSVVAGSTHPTKTSSSTTGSGTVKTAETDIVYAFASRAEYGASFTVTCDAFLEKYDQALAECVAQNPNAAAIQTNLKDQWTKGGPYTSRSTGEEDHYEYTLATGLNIWLNFLVFDDHVYYFGLSPSASEYVQGVVAQIYCASAIMAVTDCSYDDAVELIQILSEDYTFDGYHKIGASGSHTITVQKGIRFETSGTGIGLCATTEAETGYDPNAKQEQTAEAVTSLYVTSAFKKGYRPLAKDVSVGEVLDEIILGRTTNCYKNKNGKMEITITGTLDLSSINGTSYGGDVTLVYVVGEDGKAALSRDPDSLRDVISTVAAYMDQMAYQYSVMG